MGNNRAAGVTAARYAAPLTRKVLPLKCIVISSLSMVLTWPAIAHGAGKSPTTLQRAASERVPTTDEFLARWKDERNGRLVQGAFWTLAHADVDFKHAQEVLQPVELYIKAIGNGDRASLDQEGIKAFKDRLSGLLNDEDQAIRALAALLLGICGDQSYANQLAVLLKPARSTGALPHYDRGRAAMALGLVGAKQYTPELVNLLTSSNGFDRAGAAIGLGALGAIDHRGAVSRLLNDPDENVRDSAKESLAMMREREIPR